MLPKEEQYVVEWLSRYGSLQHEQVQCLLRNKTRTNPKKAIRNLKGRGHIFEPRMGYLACDPRDKTDERTIIAMWVLLQFIDKVGPMDHRPGSYPAQIYFVKDMVGYNIVVLRKGEGALLRLLPNDETLKTIVVVPDIAMLSELPAMEGTYVYAVYQMAEELPPSVEFFGGEVHG